MSRPRALVGVDFTSRPTSCKPVVAAFGEVEGAVVRLHRLQAWRRHEDFAAWLAQEGDWVGGFDFPFGLPRELVVRLGWPTQWAALVRHYAGLTRQDIRNTFAAFCAARPAGSKFAHRRTDGPAGSSPSMKWVNPPVAYMLHAGAPALLAAGVHLPGLHDGDRRRVALEAYPGLLAREVLGARSYKSDTPRRQTPERRTARALLVEALAQGRTRLGLRLEADPAWCARLVDDASGDSLDAVLCLVQAGWAALRPDYGLPTGVDPLEGWIVTI